ncbi:MAG: hypothetical protein R3C26_17795 [Calditrichia bacterium]
MAPENTGIAHFAPPYWQTTWFYGLVFVLISLIAGLFHHWRVRQKVQQAEVICPRSRKISRS